MATAKRTSFSDPFGTIGGVASALDLVRQDGATDDATVFMFPIGNAYTLKAEWSVEVSDPAEPAPDTREQPTTVQPDGLVNDTPSAQ